MQPHSSWILACDAKGQALPWHKPSDSNCASALLLSLGVALSGCGYLYRTLPDGYYPVDTGVKIYRTDKYGNRTGQLRMGPSPTC
jgi:hypothetical protein